MNGITPKPLGKHEEIKAKRGHVPKRPEFRGRLNNYGYDELEFVKWLEKGRNYGVTGAGGLIKLESDDVERWRSLGVMDLLPGSFTVQSSAPNRQHFYYIGPEVADTPLKDPETGEDIGHIRGTGEGGGRSGMVVGPGSKHHSGERYKVVNDVPIATIDQETLDQIAAKLHKPAEKRESKEKKKTETKTEYTDPFQNLTCMDVMGSWDWHMEGSQKAGPNPYGSHTNKTGHNLVLTPDDRGFYCHACGQGGGVSRLIAIRAGIMRCDSTGAPRGDDWWNTVRYALAEGLIDEATAKAAGLREQEEVSPEGAPPSIRKVTKEDPDGTIGMAEDGTVKTLTSIITQKTLKLVTILKWVSDCAVFIHTETRGKEDTEFTFVGVGAVDKRPVKFTMKASDLAEARKLSMPSEPRISWAN
jgi:hypothetical protein